MKKIALLMIILVLATSTFGAVKKTTVSPTVAVRPGTLSIGDWNAWAVLGYQFSNEISAGIGTFYTTPGSTYGLLLKADYNLAKIGEVQPSIGLSYNTTSAGAFGTINLNYGLTAMILSNLSAGFDILLVNNVNIGGANTTTVLAGAAFKGALYL